MNIYIVNILAALGAILLGYLFGGIPTSVIIGRVFFHKDPRDYYSHNAGGTNAGRVFGKKVGAIVIIIDMIKSLIPVFVVWAVLEFSPLNQYMHWSNGYYAAPAWYWLAGLFAALGHCWSIYLKFDGGKAVSTFMGLTCLTSWLQFIVSGVFGYLGVLKLTKTVSLTSIIAGVVATVTAWVIAILTLTGVTGGGFFSWMFGAEHSLILGPEYAIMVTFIFLMILIRHIPNIKRLHAGTETKIKWMK